MTCGIDIVEIKRIENWAVTRGNSLSRFYTEGELAYCESRGPGKYASLAGIFAAKEAFWKAVGTGFRQGKWQDVEVAHDDLGAPRFILHGPYGAVAELRSLPALSIAHDGAYAIAQVVWP